MDFGIDADLIQENVKNGQYEDLKLFLSCTSLFFPTESKFFAWVRSGLRQGIWNKHPIKLDMLKTQRRKIKNPRPNPRKGSELVWGYDCSLCDGQFTAPNVEVDHKVGEMKLTSIDDLVSYFKSLVMVTPQDLQIVCKECHGIKTYAERYGVSELQAKATKMAIKAIKDGTADDELVRLGVNKRILRSKVKDLLASLYEKELEA